MQNKPPEKKASRIKKIYKNSANELQLENLALNFFNILEIKHYDN